MKIFDYIIVGAGAAGSVLANRLSASGRDEILLIEAGADLVPGSEPADIRNIFPLSSFNDRYMWPDTFAHWRTRETSPAAFLQQGKILGGSSAIMGMWALRGHPDDYDEWARRGAAGWRWSDVLPYFKRLETDCDFSGPMHGQDGPLPIRRQAPALWPPISHAVHAAVRERGWADIEDMNADFGDGHCVLPVSREAGSRASAGLHYLTADVRSRPNLHVLAGHEVERLILDGRRVTGVRVVSRSGESRALRSRRCIVTAGALRTPVLLMRSGLGPGDHLRSCGIEVRHALPAVGSGLQNHAVLYSVMLLRRAGLDRPGWRPAGSTYLRWTSDIPDAPRADMGMYVRSYLAWHRLGRRMGSLAPCLKRPFSRGSVRLDPAAPDGPAIIEFNMLDDERDFVRLRDGLLLAAALSSAIEQRGLAEAPMILSDANRLMSFNRLSLYNRVRSSAAASLLAGAPKLGRFVLGRLARFSSLAELIDDRGALDAFVRTGVSGTGHVCGTCAMGAPGHSDTVTDFTGRVDGIDGLLIGDASLMPAVPSANTHLPVVMVAEKIAAGLTGDHA